MKLTPPGSWKYVDTFEFKGHKIGQRYYHPVQKLNVLTSHSEMKNGDMWIHISVARDDRIPTWQELVKVKNDFLGEDEEAMHFVPKKEDYVNLHKYCLHLWAPLVEPIHALPNLTHLVNETPCPP